MPSCCFLNFTIYFNQCLQSPSKSEGVEKKEKKKLTKSAKFNVYSNKTYAILYLGSRCVWWWWGWTPCSVQRCRRCVAASSETRRFLLCHSSFTFSLFSCLVFYFMASSYLVFFTHFFFNFLLVSFIFLPTIFLEAC